MIKNFDLEKMEKRIFRFLMVLFVFVMFNTISVGYSLVSSYIENHPKMEYVSQTNEKFYHKMVKMERPNKRHRPRVSTQYLTPSKSTTRLSNATRRSVAI